MARDVSVQIVSKLQQACVDAFTDVTTSLRAGMSEQDIATALRAHMANRGITEHWYDVPFNVLIGVERFRIGTTTTDYAVKTPDPSVLLQEGQVVFVDFAPMDPTTGIWGDWSSTCVFHPKTTAQHQQVTFLEEMRELHRRGIARITADTTGADVAQYFLDQFARRGVTLLDVHNNVGHSIHAGPKGEANRVWLDLENTNPIGPGIFTVEPGGVRESDGMVARFEECICIPEKGHAAVVGPAGMVSLVV